MIIRMTSQRETILSELRKSKEHLSADELYVYVKKKLPRVSLATIYRNLEILHEAGLIRKLEISGRQKRFDWDTEQHNHIYCVECHRIDNLKQEKKDMKELLLPSQDKVKGYSITGCRLEVVGICPACLKKMNKNKEK